MIRRITLREEFAREYGLRECRVERLGKVVALTGPNGAGKTRFLLALRDQWQEIRQRSGELRGLARPEADFGELLNTLASVASDEFGGLDALIVALSSLHAVEKHHGARSLRNLPKQSILEMIETLPKSMLAEVRPGIEEKIGWLRDTVTTDRSMLEMLQHELDPMIYVARETKSLEGGSHSRRSQNADVVKTLRQKNGKILREVSLAVYLAEHPRWPAEHPAEHARAQSIKTMLWVLLGIEVEGLPPIADGWRGEFSLHGRVTTPDELSPGQRQILRWIELIHDEARDFRDSIVLLDEPERSLHPELLLTTFAKLQELSPKQIWVATHSLSLLAAIGHENVFYVCDGSVEWAGREIRRVHRGLLGEEGSFKLQTFLGDAASLEFHRFAAQCLVEPQSIRFGDGDTQAHSFVSFVTAQMQTGSKVRIIDYAAGHGRLARALAQQHGTFGEKIDYHACNPRIAADPLADAECRSTVRYLRDDDLGFHEDTDLLSYDDASRADWVILCNVLHEVEPNSWPSLMTTISGMLRPDGHLLILEDQLMPIGELPHPRGYLVLHRLALGKLFGLSSAELNEIVSFGDERLTFDAIPRSFLTQCTQETSRAAIERVRDRALEQIERLRTSEDEPPHRRGRLHAYYAMLFTNATLALR